MRNLIPIFTLLLLMATACGTGNDKKSTTQEPVTVANVVVKLDIDGMTCTGCENTIIKNVMAQEGVTNVSASHTEGIAEVHFDKNKTNIGEITKAIEDKGYKVITHQEVE